MANKDAARGKILVSSTEEINFSSIISSQSLIFFSFSLFYFFKIIKDSHIIWSKSTLFLRGGGKYDSSTRGGGWEDMCGAQTHGSTNDLVWWAFDSVGGRWLWSVEVGSDWGIRDGWEFEIRFWWCLFVPAFKASRPCCFLGVRLFSILFYCLVGVNFIFFQHSVRTKCPIQGNNGLLSVCTTLQVSTLPGQLIATHPNFISPSE